MTDERHDDEIGAALRGLGVPEHRQGFWERLDRRIGSEQAGRDTASGARHGAPMSVVARYLPLAIALLIVILIAVVLVLG